MIDYTSYVHRFILKRIKDNQLFLITKADKSFFFNSPIPSSRLMGKVIAVEKDGCYINLENVLWRGINGFIGFSSFLEGAISGLLRLAKRKILNFAPLVCHSIIPYLHR